MREVSGSGEKILDQKARPIYDYLTQRSQEKSSRYHIPGHLGGELFASAEPFWQEMGAWDWTETYGLDDLHAPETIIREAEDLIADAFQGQDAGRSYIMVNGSSSGLLAAINGLFLPGDKVLIQRNAHKSIYNAAMLAELDIDYLYPDQGNYDEIAGVLSPDNVREALLSNPYTKGIVITSPTFYGRAAEIRQLAKICQASGVLLIVDEAHGVHFPFHDKLAQDSAIRQGADLVINSIHKTLPALTMSAVLHVSQRALALINRERLDFHRSLFQTTSPSYLVMASIDFARHWMVNGGSAALERAYERKEELIRQLGKFENQGIEVLDNKLGVQDPLKLTISVKGTGLSGKVWEKELAQHQVYVELVGPSHLLLLLGMQEENNPHLDADLLAAIQDILSKKQAEDLSQHNPTKNLAGKEDNNLPNKKSGEPPAEASNKIVEKNQLDSILDISWDQELYQSEQVIGLGQVRNLMGQAEIIFLPLADCVGRVLAEFIIPYPPGIPLLAPGERMTASQLGYLESAKVLGMHFHGPADQCLDTIRVFAEQISTS